jgi:hypothetical protein
MREARVLSFRRIVKGSYDQTLHAGLFVNAEWPASVVLNAGVNARVMCFRNESCQTYGMVSYYRTRTTI